MNHYFYDHQGAIVGEITVDFKIQKGESIMFTEDEPVLYLIQAVLHIQGETKQPDTCNWLVNRLSKFVINQPYIDTTAPRQPLPLKSVQGYQQS
jgi:hypothetical protein